MDEIVIQAMSKWPNVPHCYGWLALDARGNWRMRDERAQHMELPGDKLSNPALVGFIVRNYLSDERGCWFFQNGPQRVYLNLEATPYIARTDPLQGLLLHTGVPMGVIDAAWMSEAGALILRSGEIVAQLDDRDLAQLMPHLEWQDQPVSDEALLAWLESGGQDGLSLRLGERSVPVHAIANDDVPAHFHFVRQPTAPAH